VKIVLLDVNDNAPQMPPILDFATNSIHEDFKKVDNLFLT
jgi:hypothetical protein